MVLLANENKVEVRILANQKSRNKIDFRTHVTDWKIPPPTSNYRFPPKGSNVLMPHLMGASHPQTMAMGLLSPTVRDDGFQWVNATHSMRAPCAPLLMVQSVAYQLCAHACHRQQSVAHQLCARMRAIVECRWMDCMRAWALSSTAKCGLFVCLYA